MTNNDAQTAYNELSAYLAAWHRQHIGDTTPEWWAGEVKALLQTVSAAVGWMCGFHPVHDARFVLAMADELFEHVCQRYAASVTELN